MPSGLPADLKTHPQGYRVRKYRPELLNEWLETAQQQELPGIAFVDHPASWEGIDFEVVDALRAEWPALTISVGIEVSNDPQTYPTTRPWVDANWKNLDLVVAKIAVLTEGLRIDRPTEESEWVTRQPDALWHEYLYQLRLLLQSSSFDVLADADALTLHGVAYPQDRVAWVEELIDLLRSKQMALEISSAPRRKGFQGGFPASDLIEAAWAAEVPLVCGSGTHTFADVGDGFWELSTKWGHRLRACPVGYQSHQLILPKTGHDF